MLRMHRQAARRFVEIKGGEQQSIIVLHRVRLTLMRQRIQLSNAIRGDMAEYGLVATVGRNGLAQLIASLSIARMVASLTWHATASRCWFRNWR